VPDLDPGDDAVPDLGQQAEELSVLGLELEVGGHEFGAGGRVGGEADVSVDEGRGVEDREAGADLEAFEAAEVQVLEQSDGGSGGGREGRQVQGARGGGAGRPVSVTRIRHGLCLIRILGGSFRRDAWRMADPWGGDE
jgi:hypothetical protein